MEKDTKSGMKQGIIIVAVMLAVALVALLLIPAKEWISPDAPTGETAATLPTNPFGPESFSYDYEQGRLVCADGAATTGIDVSAYQQDIDWKAVAASGVEFAFIRVGYRGYTTGELVADEYGRKNLMGAKAAGLKIGAYFFSQAIHEEEAREEAAFALLQVEGLLLDMPLAFDWEYVSETARTAGVSRSTLTACTLAFCQEVENAGLDSMIYFNQSQALDMLYLDQLQEYPWWLALYDPNMLFPYRVDMWQYTSTGRIPGIEGNVDINLLFIYEE